eukprot:6172272-Pleurochrysis_carterae.AAC.3
MTHAFHVLHITVGHTGLRSNPYVTVEQHVAPGLREQTYGWAALLPNCVLRQYSILKRASSRRAQQVAAPVQLAALNFTRVLLHASLSACEAQQTHVCVDALVVHMHWYVLDQATYLIRGRGLAEGLSDTEDQVRRALRDLHRKHCRIALDDSCRNATLNRKQDSRELHGKCMQMGRWEGKGAQIWLCTRVARPHRDSVMFELASAGRCAYLGVHARQADALTSVYTRVRLSMRGRAHR